MFDWMESAWDSVVDSIYIDEDEDGYLDWAIQDWGPELIEGAGKLVGKTAGDILAPVTDAITVPLMIAGVVLVGIYGGGK